MLVDSHCHLDRLDLSAFNGSLASAIDAARHQGVQHMLCVCINIENFPAVIKIAEANEHITASVGVHPTEEECHEPSVDELVELASHPKVVAIGETGLDYYRSDDPEWQQERFRRHIQAAKIVNKPLIIHTREAREDTIAILQQEQAEQVGGVMHCFTETWQMAQQAMELGFYISFSGIVTFKNAKELQEVAQLVPLDKMLIETDSPYLAPVPYRGKTNQPAYVTYVCKKIAELRGISEEQVAQTTTQNFFELFKHAKYVSPR